MDALAGEFAVAKRKVKSLKNSLTTLDNLLPEDDLDEKIRPLLEPHSALLNNLPALLDCLAFSISEGIAVPSSEKGRSSGSSVSLLNNLRRSINRSLRSAVDLCEVLAESSLVGKNGAAFRLIICALDFILPTLDAIHDHLELFTNPAFRWSTVDSSSSQPEKRTSVRHLGKDEDSSSMSDPVASLSAGCASERPAEPPKRLLVSEDVLQEARAKNERVLNSRQSVDVRPVERKAEGLSPISSKLLVPKEPRTREAYCGSPKLCEVKVLEEADVRLFAAKSTSPSSSVSGPTTKSTPPAFQPTNVNSGLPSSSGNTTKLTSDAPRQILRGRGRGVRPRSNIENSSVDSAVGLRRQPNEPSSCHGSQPRSISSIVESKTSVCSGDGSRPTSALNRSSSIISADGLVHAPTTIDDHPVKNSPVTSTVNEFSSGLSACGERPSVFDVFRPTGPVAKAFPCVLDESWCPCLFSSFDDSDGGVWLVNTTQFFLVNKKLRSIYSRDPGDLKKRTPAMVGQEVVVQSDVSWLRGRIEEVFPERHAVRASLTDLNVSHDFAGKYLWNLSHDLSSACLPPAVAKCYLAKAPEGPITAEARDEFNEMFKLALACVHGYGSRHVQVYLVWDAVTKVEASHVLSLMSNRPQVDLNVHASSGKCKFEVASYFEVTEVTRSLPGSPVLLRTFAAVDRLDYMLTECEGQFHEIYGEFPMYQPQIGVDEGQPLIVYVSYTISSSDFFVIEARDVDRYYNFLDEMQEFYLPYILDEPFSKVQRAGIEAVLCDSYRVAYRYGRFYRVLVGHELKDTSAGTDSATGDHRTEEESVFACFTLDMGVTMNVPKSNIFPLHKRFAELPPAVRHCGLMTRNGGENGEDSIMCFNADCLLSNSLLQMDVLDVEDYDPSRVKYLVKLTFLDQSKGMFGQDVASKLFDAVLTDKAEDVVIEDEAVQRFVSCVDDGFEKDLNDLDLLVTGKSAAERRREDEELGRICRFTDLGLPCRRTSCNFRHYMLEPSKEDREEMISVSDFTFFSHRSTDRTVVCRVDDSFDPQLPKLYEEVVVQVLHVDSLKQFFVRFPHGAVDRRRTETGRHAVMEIENLRQKLKEIYDHDDGSLKLSHLPELGEAIVVKNPLRNEEVPDSWLRASVRGVQVGSRSVITVSLLDYGLLQDVSARDCRMWSKALVEFKSQAVRCSLEGVSFSQPESTAPANVDRLLHVPPGVALVAAVKDILPDDTVLVELFATRSDPTSQEVQIGSPSMVPVYDKSSGLISFP